MNEDDHARLQKAHRFPRIQQLLAKHWAPKPIQAPKVDADLEQMTGPQRAAEVIRLSLLSLEYWLSPFGRLREWLRLNGRLSAILVTPALLVVPLVTWILWHVAQWMALLVGITGNLIVLPLVALLAVIVLSITVVLLRVLLGR